MPRNRRIRGPLPGDDLARLNTYAKQALWRTLNAIRGGPISHTRAERWKNELEEAMIHLGFMTPDQCEALPHSIAQTFAQERTTALERIRNHQRTQEQSEEQAPVRDNPSLEWIPRGQELPRLNRVPLDELYDFHTFVHSVASRVARLNVEDTPPPAEVATPDVAPPEEVQPVEHRVWHVTYPYMEYTTLSADLAVPPDPEESV